VVLESNFPESSNNMQATPAPTSNPPPRLIRFGIFEADLSAGELRKGGFRIRLQEQPFQLLVLLLERPGEIVTREELRSRLWPGDTFVDFEHGVNSAVARLRDALGDSADNPRYIETLPRRGYRLIVSVEGVQQAPAPPVAANGGASATVTQPVTQPAPQAGGADPVPHAQAAASSPRFGWRRSAALAALAAALAGVGSYFYLRPAHALTESDSIVLADFANSTSDSIFDNTLRQALAVKLIDSPFLNIVPDDRMRDTLRFMGRSPDERLTTANAREVCQRLSAKAMLAGSITQLDDHYSLLLEATNCATGDLLARAGAEAVGKGGVLKALDTTAAEIRRKLGESLSSIQKTNVPIEQATTTSLEGLKAFSLGQAARNHGMELDSIPYFQHAIELDPNFAMAYAVLGQAYANADENALSVDYTQKAFDRRDRASEREKLYISSHYYENVSRDLDRTAQIYELWRNTYPRDVIPAINLGSLYLILGQAGKAVAELTDARRLDPDSAFVYGNLLFAYLDLNRLDEAKSTFDQARARGLDSEDIRIGRYMLAFLEGDSANMKQQMAWVMENPARHDLLAIDAATMLYAGRLRAGKDLFRQAEDAALRSGRKESAAEWQAFTALVETELGLPNEARQLARASLNSTKATEAEAIAALALARSGDPQTAEALATELGQRLPSGTLLNGLDLPTIRAAAELARGNASAAVRQLEAALPYDLSKGEHASVLYSSYLRGQAYLQVGNGKAAEAEFQKVLGHRGIVKNFPQGALALLGLARARSLAGNSSGSRMAYQDFLALWKDADPEIPILRQARAEYARLH
jgi:DNA-binding winged helix-turn-helix (wHTH) protein/tetratricopeptide (TPR) repeat protein